MNQEEEKELLVSQAENVKKMFDTINITKAEAFVPNGFGRRRFSFKTSFGCELTMEEPKGEDPMVELFAVEQSGGQYPDVFKVAVKWITRVAFPDGSSFKGKRVLDLYADPNDQNSSPTSKSELISCLKELSIENRTEIATALYYLERRVLFSDKIVSMVEEMGEVNP